MPDGRKPDPAASSKLRVNKQKWEFIGHSETRQSAIWHQRIRDTTSFIIIIIPIYAFLVISFV